MEGSLFKRNILAPSVHLTCVHLKFRLICTFLRLLHITGYLWYIIVSQKCKTVKHLKGESDLFAVRSYRRSTSAICLPNSLLINKKQRKKKPARSETTTTVGLAWWEPAYWTCEDSSTIHHRNKAFLYVYSIEIYHNNGRDSEQAYLLW